MRQRSIRCKHVVPCRRRVEVVRDRHPLARHRICLGVRCQRSACHGIRRNAAVERALVGDGADAASARHLELARQALLHERQDLAAVELHRGVARVLGDLSAAHRILDHCCDHWQSSGSRADRAPENLPLLLLFLKRCRTHPRVTIPPIMLIVGCLLVCRLQHNAVDHPIPVQPASPVTFELRVRADPQHSARRKISRKLSRGLKGNRTLLPRNAFQETVHALRVKTSRVSFSDHRACSFNLRHRDCWFRLLPVLRVSSCVQHRRLSTYFLHGEVR
mmetsp:Transcript_63184/g.148800  ORF Transcript_63184/g.148800 Transcript_63184/m.148800 type:complete len:276 (+) Transcript_63184:895-1722(+)